MPALVCVIPREMARLDSLANLVAGHGLRVEHDRFGSEAWNLEPKGVTDLMAKIRQRGVPLAEYAGTKPYRGVLTGFNEAFLIDTPTRDALIQADPKSAEILKPYLRGQDIKRWVPEWAGLWMIALKSSGDHPWPWAELGEAAEACFAAEFPSLYAHLKPHETALRTRQDKGRYWWELRACAYWDDFAAPKIMYQEIQFHPAYCFDVTGVIGNNKTFFLRYDQPHVLVCLNSPLLWWHNWRYLPHMKDEALTPVSFLMENMPICIDNVSRESAEVSGVAILNLSSRLLDVERAFLDWLRLQHSVLRPSIRLKQPTSLNSDEVIHEVAKSRGTHNPIGSSTQKALREEYTRTIEPARLLAAEALQLEYRLHDLVNEAYGLTPDEVKLMWDTAPPRMPIPRPPGI